jgi:hypothetical protein
MELFAVLDTFTFSPEFDFHKDPGQWCYSLNIHEDIYAHQPIWQTDQDSHPEPPTPSPEFLLILPILTHKPPTQRVFPCLLKPLSRAACQLAVLVK